MPKVEEGLFVVFLRDRPLVCRPVSGMLRFIQADRKSIVIMPHAVKAAILLAVKHASVVLCYMQICRMLLHKPQ